MFRALMLIAALALMGCTDNKNTVGPVARSNDTSSIEDIEKFSTDKVFILYGANKHPTYGSLLFCRVDDKNRFYPIECTEDSQRYKISIISKKIDLNDYENYIDGGAHKFSFGSHIFKEGGRYALVTLNLERAFPLDGINFRAIAKRETFVLDIAPGTAYIFPEPRKRYQRSVRDFRYGDDQVLQNAEAGMVSAFGERAKGLSYVWADQVETECKSATIFNDLERTYCEIQP